MTLDKVSTTEIFGEQWEGYTLRSFPIKDGTGYYVAYESMGANRKPATHYQIKLIWSNGDTETSTAESPQELELWTKHLQ